MKVFYGLLLSIVFLFTGCQNKNDADMGLIVTSHYALGVTTILTNEGNVTVVNGNKVDKFPKEARIYMMVDENKERWVYTNLDKKDLTKVLKSYNEKR